MSPTAASSPADLGFITERLDRIGAVGRSYVDAGKMPCSVVQVARRGEVVYTDAYGMADVGKSTPVAEDSIFRFFSMTKPITSVVLMQLYEEGHFLLEDPVEKFLPALANMEVFSGGSDQAPVTRPAAAPMTVGQVLTHTSGLTYGFMRQHPVDAIYREKNLGDFTRPDYDLSGFIERLGTTPLLFEPGSSWNYSVSTDVCGALIEAITGSTLDQAFQERIFEPLKMVDTGFHVRDGQEHRFTSNYVPDGKGGMLEFDPATTSPYLKPTTFLSGGGGLVSTLADYQQFCTMVLNGGELNGNRIIGRKTLEYMGQNHLPGGKLLNELGQSLFSEVTMNGTGFGLGFSCVQDAAALGNVSSVGELSWGGAASTAFWVDPAEELTVIFLTQLLPSSTYPVRRQLRAAVYAALA